jgi:hypothetical protein
MRAERPCLVERFKQRMVQSTISFLGAEPAETDATVSPSQIRGRSTQAEKVNGRGSLTVAGFESPLYSVAI